MGSAFESASAWPSSTTAIVTATAIATTAFIAFGKISLWPRREKVLPSPLKTLSPAAVASSDTFNDLVYQPDQFPGARDVDTPYGSTRVYEFGPEDGEKVLFIHGISTSCVTLCRIAEGLVEKHGCRVMLFDLFGRGFSDGVGDLPYDERLYLSQILFVLASSPLAWTGKDARLRVVGYSLGGGIAVHLANHLPHLVDSLVLLAPSGLIDARSFGVVSRFVFSSGLIPERILAVLTRSRLQQPIAASKSPRHNLTAKLETIAKAEAADPPSGEDVTPLEHRVLMYVRWMVLNHVGFVPSFMSSVRHSPLTDQHDNWRRLADRRPGSTAIILAKSDEIIDIDDYNRQGPSLIGGKENVLWREIEGGHDFVMTHARDILEVLDEFWYSSSSSRSLVRLN